MVTLDFLRFLFDWRLVLRFLDHDLKLFRTHPLHRANGDRHIAYVDLVVYGLLDREWSG